MLKEYVKKLPQLDKKLNCLIKDFKNLNYIVRIIDFRLRGNNLEIEFENSKGEIILFSQGILISQENRINNTVQNYNELTNLQNPSLYELVYVQNSQGTAWLPGSLGGSYYGSGVYMWDGVKWVDDDIRVFEQLDQLISNLDLEIQQRIEDNTFLENRVFNLEQKNILLIEALPKLP